MPRYVVYGVTARLVERRERGSLYELCPVLPPTAVFLFAAVVKRLGPKKG